MAAGTSGCRLLADQNVADFTNLGIGKVVDISLVVVGHRGGVLRQIAQCLHLCAVAVGGFLGVGEKDVAVPFDAVRATAKNGKWYLTMNATKDGLQKAHGYKFDKAKATWVPA